MYVQVSLKLPTEKSHSLTPRNSLWSFVALDIHVQSELAKSYEIGVLKWNILKLRNQWRRSEDKLEFSFHICHWHFCDHDEFSKNVSLKDWLPEFEWVTAQSLHGQQRRGDICKAFLLGRPELLSRDVAPLCWLEKKPVVSTADWGSLTLRYLIRTDESQT